MDASVAFEDYVQCDDEACTSAELTTDEIVNTVRCDDGGRTRKLKAKTALRQRLQAKRRIAV